VIYDIEIALQILGAITIVGLLGAAFTVLFFSE